ncbi:MAG: hypothetical protein RJB26_1820 [Pseudomonadota bacterium]|jgi:hypothetical protein
MSALYAGSPVVQATPSASHTNKEGYLVDLASETATISSSASTPAKGVILDGGATTSDKSSIGILGVLPAPVRARASGTIAKFAEVQQAADGTVVTDAGTGARVIVGVALEAAVAGQLFACAMHKPVARS